MIRGGLGVLRDAVDEGPAWPWFLAATLVVGLVAFKIAVLVLPKPSIDALSAPHRVATASRAALLPARRAPLEVQTAADLEAALDRFRYDLDAVRAGRQPVPRIALASLPPDLREVEPTDRRKDLFLKSVLPLILEANARVAAERARLLALLSARQPTANDRRDLAALAARYQVTAEGDALSAEARAALRRRVDTVPSSLALAQAAIESGWGTSRFAREGNALFGQWVWGEDADGIVPAARKAGQNHEVRAFGTLMESVEAYLLNLNRHPAYAAFRRTRAKARRAGGVPAGRELAGGLGQYSSRGEAYVDDVRAMIRQNDLGPLDRARLGPSGVPAMAASDR